MIESNSGLKEQQRSENCSIFQQEDHLAVRSKEPFDLVRPTPRTEDSVVEKSIPEVSQMTAALFNHKNEWDEFEEAWYYVY
jgi:hypothetical protein